MAETICQIVYTSQSLLKGSDHEIASALQDIVDAAKRYNEAHGITGALLFSGRYFAQVLEGEEQQVMQLFTHIGKDKRHTDVHGLSFEPVNQRSFADWSMATVVTAPDEVSDLIPCKHKLNSVEATKTGRKLLEMMEYIIGSRERSLAYIETKAEMLDQAKHSVKIKT